MIDQFTKQLKGEITIARNIPILRKDKSILFCDVSSNVIKIKEKELMLGLFRDITEQKKANELRLELESNKKIQALRDNFMTIITHDLKQPLTPIIGYTEIIRDKLTLPEDLAYADKVISETYRIKEMIDKILNLIKIESDSLKVDINKINIKTLISEVIELKQPYINLKKITLTTELDCSKASADYNRLKDVIINLMDNAIKFSKKGGKIKIKSWLKKGYAYISIKDTGIGIRKKDLPNIFTKYFQTNEGKEAGGTGVGLAICYELIKAMNGGIKIKSKYGKGTELIIKLPK